MCKVKGFEQYFAQALAAGTKTEMENKLADEEGGSEPPAKRSKTDKENKTPRQPRGTNAKTKKKSVPKPRAKTKGMYVHVYITHVQCIIHVCVQLQLHTMTH